MITIEETLNLEALKQMEDEWLALFRQSGIDNIFLDFDWIITWWRYFSKDNSLFVLKIMEGNKLIGIAPLMIRRRVFLGFTVRSILFIGTDISDRMDFILTGSGRKEAIMAVLNHIMKSSFRWDFMDLQEMSEATGNFKIFRECVKELKLPVILGIDAKSFYVPLRGADRDKFLKNVSRDSKNRLKNIQNRLKADMDIEFGFKRYVNTNCSGISPEDLAFEIERIENSSWKGRVCSGLFSEKSSKNFHNEIIKSCFKKGLLDISFLSVKGRNIAYQFNYSHNARLYNYSAAFDARYSVFSPGLLLQNYVLESCCDSGMDEFDFLRGEEEWKNRITSNYKIHARTRIYKKSMYSKFLFIVRSCIMPKLKNKKMIYRIWMKLKEAVNVFKKRHHR